MLYFARLLVACHLVHLFEGLTFAEWMDVLRRERFRVDPRYWARAGWITGMSLGNSWAAGAVERRYGAALAAIRVEAPVFVLGHYRSGTTHLHEMLSHDRRFASPSRFQAFNPRTFLVTERLWWWKGLLEPWMLPRRVQEDEVAYLVASRLSPYLDWCFPRSRQGYARTLTFREAPAEEVVSWSAAVEGFLRALTLREGRRLILKSPPHTARMGLLLKMFPDARFIHIRRDPYAVFSSTLTMLKAARPVFRLQVGPREVDVEEVLRVYAEMYDAYFEDREHVPEGQLVEVAYEDLVRDPVGQVRGIYEGLNLADFEPFRPELEGYLASIRGYRKNRHRPLDEATRGRVARAWGRNFAVWGYSTEAGARVALRA